MLICVWPDNTWCPSEEVPMDKEDSDYMVIDVPDNVLDIDNWVEENKPQDINRKKTMQMKQYAVCECPKCNYLLEKQEFVSAVSCNICKKLHKLDGHSYIAVSGNITYGMNRGLVGDNIGKGDVVTRVSTFCIPCFHKMFIRTEENL